MALLDDFSARDLALGYLLGLGTAVVFPGLAPAIRNAGRPVLKQVLRGAIGTAEGGRDRLAELQEAFEDLVAEIRHEMEAEGAGEEGTA